MSQSQFVDYKLNSSFLPHCLLPEDDTSRVFACLFLFYFIIIFSLLSHWKLLLRMKNVCLCIQRVWFLMLIAGWSGLWGELIWMDVKFFFLFFPSPLHCLIDHLSCLSPWARPCGFGDMWIQIHHFYSYPHGSDSVRGGSPLSNLYV